MKSSRSFVSSRRRTGSHALGVLLLVKVAVAGGALMLALAGCGGGSGGGEGRLSGTVRIDGSSTVFPMTSAVAEEFMNEHPRVRVAVSKSGTGAGFAKFLRRETDINDASRPITAGERSTAEGQGQNFIELPVAYDGIAVVANPKNDWAQCLTAGELKKMWKPDSNVDNWNQVRPGFPDQPLELYGPGTVDGTFDYFTNAVVGESGQSRSDYNASEDDNVLVQGVEGNAGALGFFGLAYYQNNAERLKLLGVDDDAPRGSSPGSRSSSSGASSSGASSEGEASGCVKPSAETVSKGTYQPLSRPLFIYIDRAKADDPATEAFVEFYLNHIGDLAGEVGYVPLAEQEYDLALQRFQNRTTGSMFEEGGAQMGVSLEALLQQGPSPSSTDSTGTDSTGTDSTAPDTSATASAAVSHRKTTD